MKEEGPHLLTSLSPHQSVSLARCRERVAVILGSDFEQKRRHFLDPGTRIGVGRSALPKATPQHFRIDDAGIERDGGHAVGEFIRQGPGETFNGPLGGAVWSDLG